MDIQTPAAAASPDADLSRRQDAAGGVDVSGAPSLATVADPTPPAATNDECVGREGKYVPWSWGELFDCDTCGGRVRQSHTVKKQRGEGYDAVYPIPPHPTSASRRSSTEPNNGFDVLSEF